MRPKTSRDILISIGWKKTRPFWLAEVYRMRCVLVSCSVCPQAGTRCSVFESSKPKIGLGRIGCSLQGCTCPYSERLLKFWIQLSNLVRACQIGLQHEQVMFAHWWHHDFAELAWTRDSLEFTGKFVLKIEVPKSCEISYLLDWCFTFGYTDLVDPPRHMVDHRIPHHQAKIQHKTGPETEYYQAPLALLEFSQFQRIHRRPSGSPLLLRHHKTTDPLWRWSHFILYDMSPASASGLGVASIEVTAIAIDPLDGWDT